MQKKEVKRELSTVEEDLEESLSIFKINLIRTTKMSKRELIPEEDLSMELRKGH